MRTRLFAIPALALSLCGPLWGHRGDLALREVSIDLPGAPTAIVPADVDGDGLTDLLVVIAYTEWSQIVTEESVEMDQVEELVEMMTIVPSLADRCSSSVDSRAAASSPSAPLSRSRATKT